MTYDVVFVDSPDDEKLAKCYSLADLFIFASWYEGWSLPPLEAMACGTPVVTTDCKGIRDYVIHNYNALVVPPRDIKALAEASIKLLTNSELTTSLRNGGLKTAKELTWDKVVERFEHAIREFVG